MATRKKNNGAKSRRTKNEILRELEDAQRLLIEKEEELVICQEKLSDAPHLDGTAFDSMNQPETDLSVVNEALETELAQLKTELATAQVNLKTMRVQVDTLTRNSEETALAIPSPSVDAVASIKEAATQQKTSSSDSTSLNAPEIVPIKIAPIVEIVHHQEPFSATINIDYSKIANAGPSGFYCTTRLFAKRLSDNWSTQVGESTVFYDGANSVDAPIKDLVLPMGTYYLQAVAAFTTTEGTPLPAAAIHEGDFLQVV